MDLLMAISAFYILRVEDSLLVNHISDSRYKSSGIPGDLDLQQDGCEDLKSHIFHRYYNRLSVINRSISCKSRGSHSGIDKDPSVWDVTPC
jgi:hypothetical protein